MNSSFETTATMPGVYNETGWGAPVRREQEKREAETLSPFACASISTRGRMEDEPPCECRTVFHVDRDRIVFSNAFRRLKHKTQVFLSPFGDHFRTRLTHTLEVAQLARTLARGLRMNEDLAEAVALGHDLGHTPFGHSGETALKEVFSPAFSHNEQSLRVVDVLENNGRGLNLTFEVRDGILKHSKGYGKVIPDNPRELPRTVEGRIVRIADIIAYLNHDLDDALRSGVITRRQTPDFLWKVFGETHAERAQTMIRDVIRTSRRVNGVFRVDMSEGIYAAMTRWRVFLYENVYRAPSVHHEFEKAKHILTVLYNYFLENETLLRAELKKLDLDKCDHESRSNRRIVCDLIASMSDRYALALYERLFIPSPIGKGGV